MKILIVDDAKLIHFMVKKILAAKGLEDIQYADAFDGQQAVDMAKEFNPDLILLDVIMPEKDGIEALAELKQNNPDVHVIMVSSMGTEEKVSEALKLGAKAFIQKPFDEDELHSHVTGVMNGN